MNGTIKNLLATLPDSARPTALFLTAFVVLYTATSLALSLAYSPLGDQGVEADFLAEIVPAAQKLVRGEFAVANYPFKGPVTSLLLAAIHTVVAPFGGGWYRSGVLLSLLAAGGTLVLLFRLANRLSGPAAAVIVVILTAATKIFFIHAGKASSDHVFAFFVFVAADQLLVRSPRRSAYLLAGVAGGLAFLTRYIGVVVPLWALGVVLIADPERLRRPQRLQAATLITLGFLAVLTPWLILAHLETGSWLPSKNLQNIVAEFYPSQRAAAIPSGGFDSIVHLIGHDPLHFVTHYLGNIPRHLGQDFQQITGTLFGCLAGLGFGLMIWRRPDRRQIAFLGLGVLYFLALCTVFYLPRFSLLLTPIYAWAVAYLCLHLPRWRVGLTVVIVAALVGAHVGHIARAVAFYRDQQPVHLAGAIAYLRAHGQDESSQPAVVMARKPHLAHYADLEYRPYPARFTSAADLLRIAAQRGADFLVVGVIERGALVDEQALDHLDTYLGVELVYQDSSTRVFALRVDDPDYATRAAVIDLRRRRQSALAAGDAELALQQGLTLARLLTEDGDYQAAHDVMREIYATAGGRRDPEVGLDLSWLCLRIGATASGLEVLQATLDGAPQLHGTMDEARGLGIQGQLLAQQGDVAAARRSLAQAQNLYRALGSEQDARAVAADIERLPSP